MKLEYGPPDTACLEQCYGEEWSQLLRDSQDIHAVLRRHWALLESRNLDLQEVGWSVNSIRDLHCSRRYDQWLVQHLPEERDRAEVEQMGSFWWQPFSYAQPGEDRHLPQKCTAWYGESYELALHSSWYRTTVIDSRDPESVPNYMGRTVWRQCRLRVEMVCLESRKDMPRTIRPYESVRLYCTRQYIELQNNSERIIDDLAMTVLSSRDPAHSCNMWHLAQPMVEVSGPRVALHVPGPVHYGARIARRAMRHMDTMLWQHHLSCGRDFLVCLDCEHAMVCFRDDEAATCPRCSGTMRRVGRMLEEEYRMSGARFNIIPPLPRGY